jgi:adenylate kinase family enzyme
MRLLLLAPPGAGKGTQGERLAARYGVRHIAAGDLLRAEAQAYTPVGREIAMYQSRGDLVPDQIVLDALTPAIRSSRWQLRMDLWPGWRRGGGVPAGLGRQPASGR